MKKKPQIAISLEKSDLVKVDKIASKLGISRSALIRNLVKMGLDDAVVMNNVGVVDIMGAIRRHKAPDRTAAARPSARTEPATSEV